MENRQANGQMNQHLQPKHIWPLRMDSNNKYIYHPMNTVRIEKNINVFLHMVDT